MKRVVFFLFLNLLAVLQTWGQVSYQSDSRGNGVGFVSNGYYITQQNVLGFYNSFTQTPLFCFSPLNVSYSKPQTTCLTSVAPFSLAATQVMNSFQTYVGQFVDWQIELGCID